MKKVTAPAGSVVHGPDNPHQDTGHWWVEGVLYTDDPAMLRHFERGGYTIEDAPDGPPAEYSAAVKDMQQKAGTDYGQRPAAPLRDALDPEHRNYT
ncbi:hypothetical protein [Streptomyces sp. NPDC005009]